MRGARHPPVTQPVDPVLPVAIRPATERPRAHSRQLGRLLLRQLSPVHIEFASSNIINLLSSLRFATPIQPPPHHQMP